MHVLVAYASRHGATRGIAERIGEIIRSAGLECDVTPADAVTNPDRYDAFVVGGGAYIGSWLKEATQFVEGNRALLVKKPVWLFSSGPLGTDPLDAKGRDQKVSALPKGLAEIHATIGARGLRVFFGAYHAEEKPASLGERLVRMMPASKSILPEGDFRDWAEIEAWAAEIAAALQPVAADGSRA